MHKKLDKWRAAYDFSKKPFEVLFISYRFDKYARKLINKPDWLHWRYYETLEGANDALEVFRNRVSKVDYPSMGNIENEKKYSHLKPTITIYRYMVIKRML